jgi:hypothetical protein
MPDPLIASIIGGVAVLLVAVVVVILPWGRTHPLRYRLGSRQPVCRDEIHP